MGQVLRGDARAGVHDRQQDLVAIVTGLQPHPAARRCVAERVVHERGDHLPDAVLVRDHRACAVGLGDDRDPRGGRPGFHVTGDGGEQRICVHALAAQGQGARVREAHRAQVVHDAREEPRLGADRLEVAGVVRIDTVQDRGGRRVDDGERSLELVGGVLEEPAARGLGVLELRGHPVEGAPERADLVAPVAKPGAHLGPAARDLRRGMLQAAQRARHPGGEQDPQQGRHARGHHRDRDDGLGGLQLDLRGVLARDGALPAGPWADATTAPGTIPASGFHGRAVGLDGREAATHDRGCRQRDGERRQQRDKREGRGQPHAEAHARAPR